VTCPAPRSGGWQPQCFTCMWLRHSHDAHTAAWVTSSVFGSALRTCGLSTLGELSPATVTAVHRLSLSHVTEGSICGVSHQSPAVSSTHRPAVWSHPSPVTVTSALQLCPAFLPPALVTLQFCHLLELSHVLCAHTRWLYGNTSFFSAAPVQSFTSVSSCLFLAGF
jgi:hypothetical protein